MITFYEYILLREVLDVVNSPTDDIEFDVSDGRIEYSYTGEDGTPYRVTFSETSSYFFDLNIKGYDITFQAGGSYSLTGKQQAPTVYKPMLTAIKKLIEERQPDLLYFHGANSSQDVMYDVFINRYLNDSPGKPPHQVFYRIDDRNLISKKFFMTLPLEKQEQAKQAMQNAASGHKQYISSARKVKKERHGRVAQSNYAIGQFLVRGNRLCFVISKNEHGDLNVIDIGFFIDTNQLYFDPQMDQIVRIADMAHRPEFQDRLKKFLDILFGTVPDRFQIKNYVFSNVPQSSAEQLRQLYTAISGGV